ncbi:MAG: hypothetical protein Aurels2KO_46160 [Aureliella sp.]
MLDPSTLGHRVMPVLLTIPSLECGKAQRDERPRLTNLCTNPLYRGLLRPAACPFEQVAHSPALDVMHFQHVRNNVLSAPGKSPVKALRYRCGFSLIELVTVTLIISIVSTVAISKFASSGDRFDVEASARRLARSLSYAQRHARATGTEQLVSFDPGARVVAMPDVSSPNRGGSLEIGLQELGYKSAFTTDFPFNQFTFSMHGTASHSGSVTVSHGGFAATISVFADSGRVIVSN